MNRVRAGSRIIIVGTGPAGFATARAYREHGGRGNVTMIGRESRPPYRRPPLTKQFLRGEIDAGELPLAPAGWFEEQEIDLLLGLEVSALDAEGGSITLDGQTLSGDAVVLATGAEPARPDLPGLDDPRVHTVREQPDSELLSGQVQAGTRVVVLGTGFIGCEIAASLAMKGAEVAVVGREPGPLHQRLGPDASARVAGWLTELGVELRMETELAGVRDARTVELHTGAELEAELVIAAMGVVPRCGLAQAAGLAIVDGRIRTDERMRAGSRIFAVGDVAYALNQTAGRRLAVEHWGDALAHGEVAGKILAGQDATWDSVPGFWSTIGEHTLKYAAWGDGYDGARLEDHEDGGFTIWYQLHGVPVGVLTYRCDDDYTRGSVMVRDQGSASW